MEHSKHSGSAGVSNFMAVQENKPALHTHENKFVWQAPSVAVEMCELSEALAEYLNGKGLFRSDAPWRLGGSKLGGRGLFATRRIQAGELVLVDAPFLLGPRVGAGDMCAACYAQEHLASCRRNCGLLLCSETCYKLHLGECRIIKSWSTTETRAANVVRYLTPIRSLLLGDAELKLLKYLVAHPSGGEVDALKRLHFEIPQEVEAKLRHVCAVLDANAFEVQVRVDAPRLRALYSASCFINHSCVPNTIRTFDGEYMVVRATKVVQPGEEIFTSYCRLLWGTLSRQHYLLRTKHFTCLCQRCLDPTEMGTYMSALLCKNCPGYVLPSKPLEAKASWKCSLCSQEVPSAHTGFLLSALAGGAACLDEGDVAGMLGFAKAKLSKVLPETNQVYLQIKYRVAKALGRAEGYLYSDLSEDMLNLKENYCRDLLEVIEKLEVGESKLKGTMLYEIFKCQEERNRRTSGSVEMNNNEVPEGDTDKLIRAFCNIYMFDPTAPDDIKHFWKDMGVSSDWRSYF